ncbi:single-stranded DNA-binding protein [Helcococcus ovis]|uniref:Single-stranded DNA-binding protein n=1 Tax=Helcococcus ovis TaxID=72026 RepID=A0A4R9C3I9_9FIRM|nr:single-stranded DNA-binding protein [Helcococcus ovis]TFF66037.1 single-stranded DNA-binding protein [Helcococcus ovis]TFF66971.1 single-stranded DNA-binding protein [Helcococcus ovis]TFF68577.1 single-stranded DNA-binding protein [Helcococcus ovis]WNZ01304.1 single-stranded DNA-binding protein [Helcococcus ovis]
MNNVVLMGRLTRDPELRYTQGSNMAYVRLNVAVDKNLSREKKQEMESKGQPTADFINVVAWGKLGENIAKFTSRGLRVLVTGRIQTGSYEKDGQKVYTTDVLASNVEFLDWKGGNNSASAQQPVQNQSNNQQPSQPDSYTPPIDDNFEYSADFDPTEDKRIPF